MKRKILALYSHENAVENYRTIRPLERVEHKVTFQDFIAKKRRTVGEIAETLYKKGDVWFIKYLPENDLPEVLTSCRNILNSTGKKVRLIVDIDDNVFEIPFENIASFFWSNKRKSEMAAVLKQADMIIASTNPLKNYLKRFNDNVVVLKNCLDLSQWKDKKKKNKVIKIGWVYSKTHIPDIQRCADAIKEIKEEFGDKISIELLGGDRGVFDCDTKVNKPVPFTEYPKKLQSLNWDISIAPLADNEFNKGKSNIKWLESTMACSAFIGSNVYPYEHSIKNGETGFICGSKNQWKNALRKLITDEALREGIVKKARKEVTQNYDIDKEVYKYNKLFELI
jgi:glycosyltransferase involved in cell wall biosynthesis